MLVFLYGAKRVGDRVLVEFIGTEIPEIFGLGSVIAKGFILLDENLRKLQSIQEDIRDQTHRQ